MFLICLVWWENIERSAARWKYTVKWQEWKQGLVSDDSTLAESARFGHSQEIWCKGQPRMMAMKKEGIHDDS